ncbi:MAG: hypothetical protein DRO76_05910 [Candidatus Altiarchaeales archaeon]|nr:MAG: hypothetical protein DRO76_05910 [Candidatus Altiarchaeales archaeon]
MIVKTLILCIDRDNDIGEKIGVEGPIIGEEKNIETARDLALADPEDTDVNAIFEAIKTARELKTEIATLTGDRNVGIVSDGKIAKQLDELIEKFKPDSVVLVTDGAEDEEIIPIIQSRVKINSVKTVIVRQSKELEKAYFKITNFLREVEKDPNLARLIFVIPGLILLLIAIGGALNILMHAMLLLLAIVGIYLIIKGLGYEEEFFSRLSEFLKSLSIERISIVAYSLAVITLIIGLGFSYDEYSKENPTGFINEITTVLTLNHADIILLAVVIAIIGRIIDEYAMERYLNIRRYLILLALILLIKLIAQSGAYYLLEGTIGNFILSIILSIILFIAVIKGTELIFIEEIKTRRKWIEDYAGKKVFSKDGREIGKVSKVLLDGSKLLGIKVGRKRIDKEDIISNNGAVLVQI